MGDLRKSLRLGGRKGGEGEGRQAGEIGCDATRFGCGMLWVVLQGLGQVGSQELVQALGHGNFDSLDDEAPLETFFKY